MDNEKLLQSVMDYMENLDRDEIKTVNVNQSKLENGYQGLTVDVVFVEPNKPKEEAKEVHYYE